jgi:phosphatidate cytidylyltransferase
VIAPDRRPDAGGSHKADPPDRQNFLRRTASALVLAPLAIGVAFVGGWVFAAACTLTAGFVLWEWSRLVAGADGECVTCTLVFGLPALIGAAVLAQLDISAGAIGVIAATAAFAWQGTLGLAYRSNRHSCPWAAAGILYAAIVAICPILLRRDPEMGFAALSFLFATVWATDIFAYLTGRGFGGPLLASRLSPKKTWAGAVGGLAGGVVAGVLVAYASAGTRPAAAGVLALILSIAAQGGDLFESWVKRRFGAKDTSALIPGHGGVMDRVDGFLVAALIAVVIGALRFGAAAPARGLLLW